MGAGIVRAARVESTGAAMPASLARRQVHGKRAVSVAGYFFVGFFFLPAVAAAALIGFFVVLAIEHL